VFSCGGIGATPDDHTRQCAAKALGRPLAAPARRGADPRAHAGHGEGAGHPLRARPRRQHPPPEHGRVPGGRRDHPNPYNKIPGFTVGDVHFVPGFPVMAWPMMEWVLDTKYSHLFRRDAYVEKSVIVFGSMEATLTPLMEQVEREHPG
jgi:molybdopterin-biosynthesis enzyme MoeA-like protein